MTVHYTEGPARAVIRGETVVVLPDKTDDALLTDLWTQLAGVPDGVAAALGVLTALPGGLTAVPPFAVVSIRSTGEAHVAVRGAGARVTVRTPTGPVEVTGRNVISWSEQVIEEPTSFAVTTGGASPAVDGGYPVESAVVPTTTVRRVLVEEADAVAPDREPEPAGKQDEASIFARIPGVSTPPPPPPAAPSAGSADSGASASEARGGSRSPEPDPGAESAMTIVGAVGESGDAPSAAPSDSSVPEATQMGGGDDEYEHLFGATIMRSVEDAAVRAEEDEDEEEEGPAASPPPPPASPPVPVPAPDAPAPGAGEPGLISAIPGGLPGSGDPARATPGGTPAAAHRAAAVSGAAEGASSDGDAPDDHDGHTVMQSDLADLRRSGGLEAPTASPEPAPSPLRGGVEILAVTCPNGHANPPNRSSCRTCGDDLSGEPAPAPRPKLGRLTVTTGSVQAGTSGGRGEQAVDLDRSVIVGRRPRTSTTSASEMPRLVTVSSPNQDISRSHLEVTLEEWQVLVADMATTNGTMLIRPGQPPRRLHPNEKEIVVDGDVIDLGDGVTLKFEGIW